LFEREVKRTQLESEEETFKTRLKSETDDQENEKFDQRILSSTDSMVLLEIQGRVKGGTFASSLIRPEEVTSTRIVFEAGSSTQALFTFFSHFESVFQRRSVCMKSRFSRFFDYSHSFLNRTSKREDSFPSTFFNKNQIPS
jgi:hypothetical protein